VARRGLPKRAARRDARLLPGALEEIARSLRAGRSLRQALDEAGAATPGALGAELSAVARRAAEGVPLEEAAAWWREQRPTADVRLAAAALVLCTRAGGQPARALDGVAASLRAEQALAGEVRAQSAQARLSAVCATMAPLAFTALTCATDHATAAFLLHTPAGWACLAAGLGLDAVAALWMRRILADRP
jgi:tight adherence protein B